MKIAIWAMSLILFSTSAIAEEQVVVGEAHAVSSDKLLYVEKHRYLPDGHHEVRYFTPDGEQFAHKELSYAVSEQAPSFTQINDLRGELIDVQDDGDYIKLRYREAEEGKVFKKRFKRTSKLLIDAGFDRYVKNNWSRLTSDASKLEIEYLVPSRTTTVGFEVSQTSCLAGTKSNAVCFAIAPQSWWVSLAVDPLIVAYDPSSRNLLRFTGRGNIADKDGQYQSVDIRYRYPENDSHITP